jgi:predicted Zn-dependent protease
MIITDYEKIYDIDEKLKYLLSVFENNKDNIFMLTEIFNLSCQIGKFDGAKRCFEYYLENHFNDRVIRFCLGCIYYHCGEIKKAKLLLEERNFGEIKEHLFILN